MEMACVLCEETIGRFYIPHRNCNFPRPCYISQAVISKWLMRQRKHKGFYMSQYTCLHVWERKSTTDCLCHHWLDQWLFEGGRKWYIECPNWWTKTPSTHQNRGCSEAIGHPERDEWEYALWTPRRTTVDSNNYSSRARDAERTYR